MGQPNDAHAAPLLESLQLPSLESRRRNHVVDLVENKALARAIHPALADYFSVDGGGRVTGGSEARIGAGRKRFRHLATLTCNEHKSTDLTINSLWFH